MHFFIAFLILYFWVLRGWRSRFYWTGKFLREYASRFGGNLMRAPGRRYIYVPAGGGMEVEAGNQCSTQMTIRIRRHFRYSLFFVRLPRLLYAFCEAYIDPLHRGGKHPYYVYGESSQISEIRKQPEFLTLFDELSRAGFSLQVGVQGLKLRRNFRRGNLTQTSFQEYLRLAERLSQLFSGEFAEIPVHEVPSEQHCAYCKELLKDDEAVTRCLHCSTPHHSDCFELNGKCSVFGCESDRSSPPPLQTLEA